MSTTYSLYCPSKKICLWIGQTSCGGPLTTYTDDQHAEALAAFLVATDGEAIHFEVDCDTDMQLSCKEFSLQNIPK